MRKTIILLAAVFLLTSACSKKKDTPASQSPADINSTLYAAAAAGNAAEVSRLLKSGASPEAADPGHDSSNPDYGPRHAVEAAILANSFDSVSALFSAGAIIPAGSESVHGLLQKESPDIRIIRLISDRKWNFAQADLGGDTPMDHAVRSGHTDIVRFFLGKGLSYNEPGKGPLSADETMALSDKNAAEKKEARSAKEFSGKFVSARVGFEGNGFYATFTGDAGKSEFRFDAMPEIPFFVTGDSGMPEMNKSMSGKEFFISYIEGSETDPRGSSVRVNRVRTCTEIK